MRRATRVEVPKDAVGTNFRFPYVIGYSGEAVRQSLRFVPDLPTGGVRLEHVKPRPDDRAYGVLRARILTSRLGRPDFTRVNVLRQWRCMDEALCQICEGPGRDPETGRVWWLLSGEENRAEDALSGLTNAPPTCRSCIPSAVTQCPHLRRAAAVYSVAAYQPFAVIADMFEPHGATAVHVESQVPLRLDSPFIRLALATQLMVRLRDARPEAISQPARHH